MSKLYLQHGARECGLGHYCDAIDALAWQRSRNINLTVPLYVAKKKREESFSV